MNFIKSLFERSPRIETDRLILRRMNTSDAADMFEYARLPEVTKYLLWAPHEDRAYTKRYLRQVEISYKRGDFHDFGIEYKADHKFIGTCGFASLDMPNSKGEIGYVLNPDYWRRGIACEAVRAVMRFGFEKMNLNRIEARYMAGNLASRRVMEKCGMIFEGIQRQSLFVKEGFCDIGICSMLAEDFRAMNMPHQKFTNI